MLEIPIQNNKLVEKLTGHEVMDGLWDEMSTVKLRMR